MKTRFLLMFLAIIGLTITTVSCNSDDSGNAIVQTPSKLTLTFSGDNIAEIKSMQVSFKETNSGEIISKEVSSTPFEMDLKKGSYTATANGTVVLKSGEEMETAGTISFDLTTDTQNINIPLSIKAFNEDFIIEEVFFTGVQTLEGKAYNSGKYFKLTNNTDKVLNTAGLLIMKSEFNPSLKYDISPEIREQAFAVSGVLMIPTNLGKEVQPGDFVVIADMATNHKTANIPAFDLSNADYEFPNLDNPALGQVDNPAVPDATVIYTTMNYNMFFLHNRGLESYAIARFPAGETVESWLANHKYDYQYPNQAGNITQKSVYTIPNEWILDGVNCAVPATWLHNPLASSIDSGYTACGTINSDPERFGKTVRRKIIGTKENGKPLYKDTNNSDVDFTKSSSSSFENGIVH
ncbi:DUF4876 domain-containing protein [Flavobacterium sp. CBA20B-1]|uniref:DUF4876 domain-containing protein n=1 Tax=unclassified Flavobacterium TaxID=196869 RepID=UPI002223F8E8|nr:MULTISPECIES: DUF4876 domain-containing protein [unclassified Flavobacterium]WCM41688.1 DUF4876 domain-containing protein [Flavobacterium sp. CBA20B-1]